MPSTTPSMSSIISELQTQNANLPTEKKQNIIVVQDNRANQEDKTGQMLTVLNNIFSAVSEQLRLSRESFKLQEESQRLKPSELQKEAMDVSSGRYEPPTYGSGGGGGGTASPTSGGGIIEQAGKVGGGLWEGAKRIGRSAVEFAKEHPIGTAVAGGIAAGTIIRGATGGGSKGEQAIYSNKEFMGNVQKFAAQEGLNPHDILAMMKFESGGKFNTSVVNKYGYKGLWQAGKELWNDQSLGKKLRNAGFDYGTFQNESASRQLEAYQIYYQHHKQRSGSPLNTLGDLAQLQLAPGHLGKTDVLYKRGQSGYGPNSGLDINRDGVITKQEYAARISGGYGKGSRQMAEAAFGSSASPQKNDQQTATKMNPEGLPQGEGQRIKSVITQIQGKGGAKRNLAITDTLEQKLSEAIQAVYGEGAKGVVYSGGQDATGKRRVGKTHRHDEGHAADTKVYDSQGKLISGDRLAPLAQYWRAMGYGGIGLEMGKGGIHLDERKGDFLRKYGGAYDWSYGTRTKEQLQAIRRGEKGILPEMANPQLAGITQGRKDTQLAQNDQTLPRNGRHELVQTGDQKSSVLQASMFAPLKSALDSMNGILKKIEGNTGETKEELKKDTKSEDKGTATKAGETEEEQTATPVEPENPEKGYTATDFLDEEGKKKYEEAKQKALDETLKTGKEGINEDDIANQMSEEDRDKFNSARQKAKEAGGVQTATPVGGEENPEDILATALSGNDEGSNVMKMLFGQGGFMGSAEPIEPGSAKRRYIDSLPSYKDELGEMVRNLIMSGGEGEVDLSKAFGGSDPTSQIMKGMMGGQTAIPSGTSGQLEQLGVTPMSGSEQFIKQMGIGSSSSPMGINLERYYEEHPEKKPEGWDERRKPSEDLLGLQKLLETRTIQGSTAESGKERELSSSKADQLSNLGVTPFGGGQNLLGGFGVNPFGGSFGNNPFGTMQNVLGQIGSVASIGQGIGSGFGGGGMYGVQSAMGQIGGLLGSMGNQFPMASGIGGMMGGIGNIMGAVQGFGQGGGIAGGINTASSVLGTLGNVFGPQGSMGGMMGGLQGILGGAQGAMGSVNGMGGMLGNLGVNPFGAASSVMGAAGGLMNTAQGLGSSLGGLFGGIGDSLGGLFGGDSGGGGISSKGIGDDAASLKGLYSTEQSDQTGGNLEGLQESSSSLSSSGGGSSFGAGSAGPGPQGGGGSSPADVGTMGSSTGASGGSGFKLGSQRAGSSSGAMGNSISPYNNCNVLYQWLYRNMWWAKV